MGLKQLTLYMRYNLMSLVYLITDCWLPTMPSHLSQLRVICRTEFVSALLFQDTSGTQLTGATAHDHTLTLIP
jgi:hypothetical protein